MKFKNTTLILGAAACLLAFTVTSVSAQGKMNGNGMRGMNGGRGNGIKAGTEYGFGMKNGAGNGFGIIGILKAAGDELTDEQIVLLKEVEPGLENHDARMAILTDSQVATLEAFREEHPGMQGRRGGNGQSTGFGIIGILKAAGDELTDEQIVRLKEIEPGLANHDARMAILTDSQVEALEAFREEHPGMQGRRGGNGQGTGFGNGQGNGFGIIGILKAAGDELTDEQIVLLKEIEPGLTNHDARMAILTDSQVATLDAFREEHPGMQGRRGGKGQGYGIGKGQGAGFGKGQGNRLGFIGILNAAGDELTDEQIVRLKEIEPGLENHDARMAILTDTQVAVLEAHRAEIWGDANESADESFDSVEKALDVQSGPEAFSVLKQNYPNPFNPVTSIEYQIAAAGDVIVQIYGPSGQLVATLVDEYQSAGQHSAIWNASSHASGIYLCKISSGEFTSSVKMTYIK
jgi:hypothetical protein